MARSRLTAFFSKSSLVAVSAAFALHTGTAHADGVLHGENYIFKEGEILSNVLWSKMTERHLQERHVRLYGANGLLAKTRKLNPGIRDPEHVPAGTRVSMPQVSEKALATDDLSPGNSVARKSAHRSIASEEVFHAVEAETHQPAAREILPPAPAPMRSEEPTTIAQTTKPNVPAARLIEPEAATETATEPAPQPERVRIATRPTARPVEPEQAYRFVISRSATPEYVPPQPANPYTFIVPTRAPAAARVRAPQAVTSTEIDSAHEEGNFNFRWGTWKMTE